MKNNKTKKSMGLCRSILVLCAVVFFFSFVFVDMLRVSVSEARSLDLPQPMGLLDLSDSMDPVLMKGLRFNPADPLRFDFIFDPGESGRIDQTEVTRILNYFLAVLTIPENDVWVNLSPAEEDRIAPDVLAETELGRDMLAQDYILKQLSSSLTHPDTDTGRSYWQGIGTVDTAIGKIWIKPDVSIVYENGSTAYIKEATLKAVCEEVSGLDPLLEKITEDINCGSNFAKLRQIYNATLLAAWFKDRFKDAFYRNYINRNKISGIELEDNNVKDRIYALYTEAYRKGVYDVIKKEYDPAAGGKVKRRFFSGGISDLSSALEITRDKDGIEHLRVDDLVLVSADSQENPGRVSIRKEEGRINVAVSLEPGEKDKIQKIVVQNDLVHAVYEAAGEIFEGTAFELSIIEERNLRDNLKKIDEGPGSENRKKEERSALKKQYRKDMEKIKAGTAHSHLALYERTEPGGIILDISEAIKNAIDTVFDYTQQVSGDYSVQMGVTFGMVEDNMAITIWDEGMGMEKDKLVEYLPSDMLEYMMSHLRPVDEKSSARSDDDSRWGDGGLGRIAIINKLRAFDHGIKFFVDSRVEGGRSNRVQFVFDGSDDKVTKEISEGSHRDHGTSLIFKIPLKLNNDEQTEKEVVINSGDGNQAASSVGTAVDKIGGIDLKRDSFDIQRRGSGVAAFETLSSSILSPYFGSLSLNIISMKNITPQETEQILTCPDLY